MRHAKYRIRLNRFTSWRKATLRSLARNLLIYQSIKTTSLKAKATKTVIDKLISSAKENTLAAKRQAYKILGDHKLVSLLFNDIAGRFKDKTGGFTRIIALGKRRGDNAEIVILELTEIKKKELPKHKKEKETKTQNLEEEKLGAEKSEKSTEEKKAKTEVAVKEKPPISKKPNKKFLGGLKNIFKKERRDSSS
ncbi:MAG: 50S ribosomal protein L17 [Candidatus Omnitrophica bacterium]|nr:50S ribosomal protein L17 [Candidatus Omnitrophota bacterium]